MPSLYVRRALFGRARCSSISGGVACIGTGQRSRPSAGITLRRSRGHAATHGRAEPRGAERVHAPKATVVLDHAVLTRRALRHALRANAGSATAIARVARRALGPAITRDRAIDSRGDDRPAQGGTGNGVAAAAPRAAASHDDRDRREQHCQARAPNTRPGSAKNRPSWRVSRFFRRNL